MKNIKVKIFNLLQRYEMGLTEKQIRKKLNLNRSLHSTLKSMHTQDYPISRYKKDGKGVWIYWYVEHGHHIEPKKLKEIEKYIQKYSWKRK